MRNKERSCVERWRVRQGLPRSQKGSSVSFSVIICNHRIKVKEKYEPIEKVIQIANVKWIEVGSESRHGGPSQLLSAGYLGQMVEVKMGRIQ